LGSRDDRGRKREGMRGEGRRGREREREDSRNVELFIGEKVEAK